jgi:hypothetical protein
MARLSGFYFHQMKYWKNTARNLVTMEKENSTRNSDLFLFINCYVIW